MTEPEASVDSAAPTALVIVPGDGKSERVLTKYLHMLLEYRYGLEVELLTNVRHVVKVLKEHPSLHSVYLVQGAPVSVNSTVPILSGHGKLPLFLLQPQRIATEQRQQCAEAEVKGVHVCAWESAFGRGDASLGRILARGLTGDDPQAAGDAQTRVEQRLKKLDTLPSLPTVLGRLMKLIKDPESTMADLETLLTSEPAIALKVQQMANSAAVAGASGKGVDTLKEALTRLGTKKVGAIAQQIALINSMVQPEDSGFDLRTHWGHSLACALVADRLYNSDAVKVEKDVPFNDYWIAALLHDCGAAVLGFFFYDWYERVVETMEDEECSFYEAEQKLGDDMVTHDRLGEMVLQKAEMSEELIEAVGLHHEPGDAPPPLVALVHVANGLCSEMGFGDTEGEVTYSRPALKALGLKRETVRELSEELREPVAKELVNVVSQCLGD